MKQSDRTELLDYFTKLEDLLTSGRVAAGVESVQRMRQALQMQASREREAAEQLAKHIEAARRRNGYVGAPPA